MENRYPLFAGGRILKKEALWDLRDYAYENWRVIYEDYTNGIIKGCRVRVEGSDLVIGSGVLKYQDFIYLLKEETRVPITETNRLAVLKAEFRKEDGNPDYLIYAVMFFLDNESECRENQMELCRFHLCEGSVLRDTYKDFFDLLTEYDTVNLMNSAVAGRGQERLHPSILLQFAKEIQEHGEKDAADMAFCYEIRNHTGELERAAVLAYLADKGAAEMTQLYDWDNEKVVREMEGILLEGRRTAGREQRKNIIYVE